MELYKSTLGKTTCAGGGDDFESGLDGLMQTIVCQDIWAHEDMSYGSRRKIIVYLTDEGAHSARDGGEGGLLIPAGIQIANPFFKILFP